MQIIGGIAQVSSKVKKNIKAELRGMYDAGKLKIYNTMAVALNLIKKYVPIVSDGKSDCRFYSEISQKIYFIEKYKMQ